MHSLVQRLDTLAYSVQEDGSSALTGQGYGSAPVVALIFEFPEVVDATDI